jgi:hypothetical protein
VDGRAAAPAAGGNKGIPLGQFRERVDDRLNVDFGEHRSRLHGKSVQHVDGRIAHARPNAPCLG